MSRDSRSTSLSETFLGNTRVLALLETMLASGRVPHAVLFSGQQGCGLYTLAVLFAGEVLSVGLPEHAAQVARQNAQKGIHPDLCVVQAEGASISVDQVRAVTSELYTLPNQGSYKVVLICDAQKMTAQAQNALLKALEEPPSHGVFILTADSPQGLLTTVRSRVMDFAIVPPPVDDCVAFFAGDSLPADQLRFISELFEGNIGRTMQYFGVTRQNLAAARFEQTSLRRVKSAKKPAAKTKSPAKKSEDGPRERLQMAMKLLAAVGAQQPAVVAGLIYRCKNRDELRLLLDDVVRLLPFAAKVRYQGAAVPPSLGELSGMGRIAPDRVMTCVQASRRYIERNANLALVQAQLAAALAQCYSGGSK